MTRRWLDIARKDFQYARRSNMFLAVVVIFVLVTLTIVALPGLVLLVSGESITSEFVTDAELFEITATAGGTIIPITALVAAYLSVAGERQSGRLRLLLSLPPTRKDVVIGKFVARSALIAISITIAYGIALVASLLVYLTVPVETVVLTLLLSCLMGICYVGLAVGISASTRSRMQALAVVLVFFVVTSVFWSSLLAAIQGLGEFAFDSPPDGVLAFLEVFPPSATFSALYDNLVGAVVGPSFESDTLYRTNLFMLLLLAVWTIGPLAFGYRLFERTDLE